jgi:flagellar basal-body rod modification protein FlgD
MANELVSPVTNGQYTKTHASQEASKAPETASTGKTEAKKDKSGPDQEMFLQLLVAEMQYQDPLQPTDNGQYLSQLASFTQIEAIQSVQAGMENIEGNSLVGNYVSLNINGEEISGIVDFVKKDDEKGLMVSVDGELYEKSKITAVVDGDFYMSKFVAEQFIEAASKVPSKEEITVKDGEKVANATSYLNAFSTYPRAVNFVPEKLLAQFQEAREQYEKLVAAVEEAKKKAEAEAAEKAAQAATEASKEEPVEDNKKEENTTAETQETTQEG